MATEDIRIDGGRLTVERPSKGNTDVDLASVKTIRYERSLDPNADGALLLAMHDGSEHVIRVSTEDATEIVPDVYDKWRSSRREAADESPDLLSELKDQK